LEASPTAAITVPITSGPIVFGGGGTFAGEFKALDVGMTNASIAGYTDGHAEFGTLIRDVGNNVRILGGSESLLDVKNAGGVRWQVNMSTAGNTGLWRAADGVLVINDGTLAGSGNRRDLRVRRLETEAGTTSQASLIIPHGAAPTSPVDGDIWTTTAGLYVRINGATVGPLS
jgi:hypothetical protein